MHVTITHLGCAGHFIGASECAYRRHTQIATAYRVSTVGDYYPSGQKKRAEIGVKAYFETMVFRTAPEADKDNEGCGCHKVIEWSEVECRRYKSAGEAQVGHDDIVAKYAKMLNDAEPCPRCVAKGE